MKGLVRPVICWRDGSRDVFGTTRAAALMDCYSRPSSTIIPFENETSKSVLIMLYSVSFPIENLTQSFAITTSPSHRIST